MSRVCLITGGTQGIGKSTAKLLASEGWKVAVSGRNNEKGQAVCIGLRAVSAGFSDTDGLTKVVDEIKADGGEATFINADVSTQESVKKLHEEVIAVYGKLDGAVNNAG